MLWSCFQKTLRFDCLVIHYIGFPCLVPIYSNNIEFDWHSPQLPMLIGCLLYFPVFTIHSHSFSDTQVRLRLFSPKHALWDQLRGGRGKGRSQHRRDLPRGFAGWKDPNRDLLRPGGLWVHRRRGVHRGGPPPAQLPSWGLPPPQSRDGGVWWGAEGERTLQGNDTRGGSGQRRLCQAYLRLNESDSFGYRFYYRSNSFVEILSNIIIYLIIIWM